MTIQKDGASGSSPTRLVRPHQSALINRSINRSAGRRALLTGLLAVSLVTFMAPSLSFANSSAADVSKESGLGAAAAVSSLIYGPAKIIYATGGLVVGAFAWAFTAGDTDVANKVFTRSLRGNYVITPAMLTGDETLEFIGRDDNTPTTSASAVASAGSVSTQPPEATYEDPSYDDMGW